MRALPCQALSVLDRIGDRAYTLVEPEKGRDELSRFLRRPKNGGSQAEEIEVENLFEAFALGFVGSSQVGVPAVPFAQAPPQGLSQLRHIQRPGDPGNGVSAGTP